MPEELKPCPFCGGEAKFGANKSCCGRTVRIDCTNPECGGCVTTFSSKAEATKAWNRRAQQPNEPLTLDELRKMDGDPVWIAWDDIGWAKVVLIDGYPRIAAVVNHGSGYQCHLYTPYDIDGTSHAYAHKPEGST